jgi:hypothetical protein
MVKNLGDNEDVKIIRDTQRYTFKYRIIKTSLMILAWIAYGLSIEIIGPTFEDLKVRFGMSYKDLAFGLVLRSFGALIFTFLTGLVLDKLGKYVDLIMAITSVLRCLRKFLYFIFLS